jgi:hypothetical protein
LTVASIAVLLCVHEGLTRFYPILGSKPLAIAINGVYQPGDRILIDGEYTLGSTLNFYTQQPVSLVDGRMNGTWYGSYWPDAPHIFETNDSLHILWSSNSVRIFCLPTILLAPPTCPSMVPSIGLHLLEERQSSRTNHDGFAREHFTSSGHSARNSHEQIDVIQILTHLPHILTALFCQSS